MIHPYCCLGTDFGRSDKRPISDNLGRKGSTSEFSRNKSMLDNIVPSSPSHLNPLTPLPRASPAPAVGTPRQRSIEEEPSEPVTQRGRWRASHLWGQEEAHTSNALSPMYTGSLKSTADATISISTNKDEQDPIVNAWWVKAKIKPAGTKAWPSSNDLVPPPPVSLLPPPVTSDATDLPLTLAERAAPGTELPVKASEETRKKLTTLHSQRLSDPAVHVVSMFIPEGTSEPEIHEEDKRLSDLRVNGKSISNWETTWAPAPAPLATMTGRPQAPSPPPGYLG